MRMDKGLIFFISGMDDPVVFTFSLGSDIYNLTGSLFVLRRSRPWKDDLKEDTSNQWKIRSRQRLCPLTWLKGKNDTNSVLRLLSVWFGEWFTIPRTQAPTVGICKIKFVLFLVFDFRWFPSVFHFLSAAFEMKGKEADQKTSIYGCWFPEWRLIWKVNCFDCIRSGMRQSEVWEFLGMESKNPQGKHVLIHLLHLVDFISENVFQSLGIWNICHLIHYTGWVSFTWLFGLGGRKMQCMRKKLTVSKSLQEDKDKKGFPQPYKVAQKE